MLTYNTVTDSNGYYTVDGLISHEDPVVIALTLDDETLTTTLEHPFYTLEAGWQKVSQLEPGEHVRKSDGRYGVVQSVEVVDDPQRMYNLSVDQAHSFFVGDEEWLVHNACRRLGQSSPVDPNSPGGRLARTAKNLYGEIPQTESFRTTIAIGVLDDGSIIRAVNGEATLDVANKLGAIQAPYTDIEGHAERYLFDQYGTRLKAIGVSQTPCPHCKAYFADKGVPVFYEEGRYVPGHK